MISMSAGCSTSISFHRSVISSSHMKTQFLELKCVENQGETAVKRLAMLSVCLNNRY